MPFFGNFQKGHLVGTTAIVVCLMAIYALVIVPNDQSDEPLTHIAKEQPGPDQRPSDWAWQRRTFPHGKANLKAVQEELQKARTMKTMAPANKAQVLEFVGPSNIGGRVVDIEFNPQNNNIVYAGAATGGVFKSLDRGLTWFPIFDDQANLSIGDIAIDPLHPDTVYIGTGEANGGHNNFAGGGVYKSTDGGATWQLLGLENTVSIGRIVVDPSNTDRIFLAAVGSYFGPNPERGIYRSEDGGATWQQSLYVSEITGAIDVFIDPSNPSRLMAAMWERIRQPNSSQLYGPTSGVYRSTDGGDNWTQLAGGLPNAANQNVGRIGLSQSLSNPETAYALFTNGSGYIGLYRTNDFGNSWSNVDPDSEIDSGTGGFSWYFGQVRVHPTDPERVYVLDVAFMRSTNGGASWPIIYGYGGPSILHVDHHALAFDPSDPDYILNGNDGGINISTNGGQSFSKVADLPVNQFYEIGLDANNPDRFYGGTQDNGTLRTLTGSTSDWTRILGGDGFYVIVDHTNPDIIYAESQFGNLAKSTTGGPPFNSATNGISSNEPTNWSTPVAMDPNNNNVLYYGTDRVYRTTNAAGSWTAISGDLTDAIPGTSLGTVTTIAVAPSNSDVIWAGTDDSHVWVSSDNGLNWTDVSATLPTRWVTRVVPDPTDANIAYATFNGLKWQEATSYVFRTADQGQTWTDITNNLPEMPLNAMAVDALQPDLLFVGGDAGAYYSLDAGLSWQYLSSDLPIVSVYDMKIHPTARYLAVGTHARSIYKFDIGTLTGVNHDEGATPEAFTLDQNYPNPFNPETAIRFSIREAGPVTIQIYDAAGRQIRKLINDYRSAGEHQVFWNGRNDRGEAVSSGVYLYRMTLGGLYKGQISRKMTLIR